VGVAPIYPIARSLHEAGNKVISIIGARNDKMLFYKEEMNSVSEHLHIVTDDGSVENRVWLQTFCVILLESGEQIDLVFAIGLFYDAGGCRTNQGLRNQNLCQPEPIMVDGTGMCGGCRVSVGETSKFACIDGPDFDAHQVDFDQLLERQKMYCQEEQDSKEHWHQCNCRGNTK